ncbi:MAG: lysylphosphatidylglycerol synthase domain-containing protein, partial [Acidimicrobiales bacterium]
GAGVPWRGILVAYGLGQLAAVLPFTPGGLAVVEASLTAVLIAYGMSAGGAIAGVLVYRVISFWAVVPIGWICYGLLSLAGRDAEPVWSSPNAHAQT